MSACHRYTTETRVLTISGSERVEKAAEAAADGHSLLLLDSLRPSVTRSGGGRAVLSLGFFAVDTNRRFVPRADCWLLLSFGESGAAVTPTPENHDIALVAGQTEVFTRDDLYHPDGALYVAIHDQSAESDPFRYIVRALARIEAV